jgi:hypothetical protein
MTSGKLYWLFHNATYTFWKRFVENRGIIRELLFHKEFNVNWLDSKQTSELWMRKSELNMKRLDADRKGLLYVFHGTVKICREIVM